MFCQWAGIPNRATPNGWADSIWTCKDADGTINASYQKWQETYFLKVTNKNDVQDGDICVWGKGSSCPSSHVAMYFGGRYFGERQGGDRGFRLVDLQNDWLGALRWKEWANDMERGLNYIEFAGVPFALYRAQKGYGLQMLSAGVGEVKNIKKFDNSQLLIMSMVNANYFQMSDVEADAYGTHYGVEQTFDGVDLAPKSNGLLVFYQLRNGEICYTMSSEYWFTRNDVIFACTPYSILRHHGQNVDVRSSAFVNKENIATMQTMILNIAGDWVECVSLQPTFPSVMREFAGNLNADEAVLMDGGGSSQMLAYADGVYKDVLYTGRAIPNVLCIAKDKVATAEYEPEGHSEGDSEDYVIMDDKDIKDSENGQEVAESFDFAKLFNMKNETYDKLKYFALIVLPALATLISGLGEVWGFNADLVARTVTLFATCLGAVLIISSNIYAKKTKGDE